MFVTMRTFLLLFMVYSPTLTALVEKPTSQSPTIVSDRCILPSYPEHGTYVVLDNTTASPDQALEVTAIKYSCEPGYQLEPSDNVVVCYEGVWYNKTPRCKRLCRLERHPGVEYQCQIDKYEIPIGHRECAQDEPEGTVIRTLCKGPNFYSAVPLKSMTCVDGIWDSYPTCTSECGILLPKGTSLILDDASSNLLENNLPWHTMVYRTTKSSYILICGGSLITNSVIISAAHCFWSEIDKKLPASQFAVAVGKSYREWDNPKDTRAQKSDIKEIKIPARFLGAAANYQDDIALVFVNSPFQFSTNVRPVCLDFDYAFDNHQLQSGHFGKLSRWAFKDDNRVSSLALEVVDMAYLDIDKCIAQSPLAYREMITSDKFCTSYMTDTSTVRQGYSGSGLAFPENQRGVQRYYLRGVASTAPVLSDADVNPIIISFTHVLKHEYFIKENIE